MYYTPPHPSKASPRESLLCCSEAAAAVQASVHEVHDPHQPPRTARMSRFSVGNRFSLLNQSSTC